MLYNNLKVALRTLRKNKIYTYLNILGLTIGIAATLLIFRMVSYELSFNKNFKNYDRIARIVSTVKTSEQGLQLSVCTPTPAMDVVENTVSQFEKYSRVREMWSNLTIPNPNGGAPLKKFSITPGKTAFFVEQEFFDIFDLKWLAGEEASALLEPNTIVLTESWAQKCFDSVEGAMEQTVLIDNIYPVIVKGVIEDMPENCDFPAPFLVSFPTLLNNQSYFFYGTRWGSCSSNDQSYALLRDLDQWDAANTVLAKVGAEEYKDESGEQRRVHQLQALSDLHYNEDLGNSGTHRTGKTRLKVLSLIGILILIMACFNFINLATAQTMLRAKEVGVRKTLGSGRGELIGQFMSETGVIVLIAVILGANLAVFFAPFLNHVSDVPEELPFLSNPLVLSFLALITVLVTLLAGLYPAITLASFKPVKALSNNVSNKKYGGVAVRKSLVVLQFVIAQALIVGAIITIMQMDYIRSKDLGFDKELIYTFGFNYDSLSVARQTGLKQAMLQIPTVKSLAFSSDQPLSGNTWSSNFRYGTRPEDEPYSMNLKFCDTDYQKTYGINLLAGKWLSPSDTMREAVVNKTVLDKLGINDPQEAIGQTIQMGRRTPLSIVGVTEDFHTHSLRREHQTLMMTTRKEYYWEAGVKIRPDYVQKTTLAINKVFDEVMPEQVFTGRFLDENIEQFYQDDSRLSATCKGFGLLAILISCLGLFGLATHAAAQRVKEIGIRKVLGATLSEIISLLSKDFLKLVIIALIVASPLAWIFMNNWLDNFVFRINIEWWVFALAGIVAVVIAFLTVVYQAVKAALMNPVKALRDE